MRTLKLLAISEEKRSYVIKIEQPSEKEKRILERFYNLDNRSWREKIVEAASRSLDARESEEGAMLDLLIMFISEHVSAEATAVLKALKNYMLDHPRPDSIERLVAAFPYIISGKLDDDRLIELANAGC